MRNLLLGNGINIHLDIKGMTMDDISNRFKKSLAASSPFYELLFNVQLTEDICDKLFENVANNGIESLTEIIHAYVIKNTTVTKSINFHMRLIDALICSALTAIFYDNSERIGLSYNKSNLPNLNVFDNIFTLNYVEFWDEYNHCTHLHGKYNIDSIITSNIPLLLYSHERYIGFEGYDKIVEALSSVYNMQPLNTEHIVFSPEFSKKSEMIKLGKYPNANLFPADDLFLHDFRHLYTELDTIKTIEIFGMSPYGDDSIIEKLNNMDFVTIYVYNKAKNRETKEWTSILKCPYEIKDSDDFMLI